MTSPCWQTDIGHAGQRDGKLIEKVHSWLHCHRFLKPKEVRVLYFVPLSKEMWLRKGI